MATQKETYGTSWLAELVNEKTGGEYTGYQIRILLRKLVKDGTLERKEGRYEFTGEQDPQVLAVVRAIKSGVLEKEKADKLASIKGRKAKAAAPEPEEEGVEEEAPKTRRTSTPAAAKSTTTRRRTKAKPVVVEEDDDLDIDEL